MKKMLYCVVAIATLLISNSCQKETLDSEKTNKVSYTVEIPDMIGSKAVGDGHEGVNELVYEVWRTDSADKDAAISDNETRLYQNKAEIDANGVAHIEFELVNNQNARILFWAQCSDNDVYNVTSLKNVTVKCSAIEAENKLKSNQKKYAAFAGKDFIKNGDPLNGRTIELKRSVAQLNIATSPESLILGDDSNAADNKTIVAVSTSSVKVTGLSTSFNVATLEAGTDNTTEFVYADSNLGAIESSNVSVANGNETKTYNYVAMNYLGFAPAAGTNVKVVYTLKTNVGDITNTIHNVPVRPNYRTNIIGNLISSKTDYHVTINTDWTSPESNVTSLSDGVVKNNDGTYTITKPNGLAYASKTLFANGGTFYIADDIDMASMNFDPATVPADVTLTIIGNLQTRSQGDLKPIIVSGLNVNGKYAALIGNVAGTVSIKGINISNSIFGSDKTPGSAAAAFVANASGSVMIEDCSATGCEFKDAQTAGGLVGASTGALSVSASEVSRCTFDETENNGALVGSVSEVSGIDSNNKAYFNTNETGEDISNAVGSDPDVVIDTTPSVETDETTGAYEVSDSHSFVWAIEEAEPVDGTVKVKVVDEIVLSKTVTIQSDRTVVLDLNGKTVSQEVECTESYAMITNNGKLNIAGNGTMSFKDLSNGGSSTWGSYVINNYGELTVENGTIKHFGTADKDFDTSIPIQNYAGKVIVNGGLISSPEFRSLRDFTAGGEIVINGGVFNGQVWMQGLGNGSSTLTINGGEFGPTAKDGSSVFVTNGTNDVQVSVTGGTFNTKIGCSDPNKEGVKGAITGGTFTTSAKEGTNEALLNEGYEFTEDQNGNWVVTEKTPVATIGSTSYYSLQKAIEAVKEGETIVFSRDITQVNGEIIDSKNFTIDLNNKTFIVTEGTDTNNRNFKITGTSVVTIMNGTMIAAGNYSSGAYGTVRTEGSANVTLENVKLYNYRGNGLNVKALSGTTVNIKDSEVYSNYGGGIESAGGTIELTNVKVEQKGMYTSPYNSMAISVNGGGKVTVNSGTYSTECLTAEEANNQGTSHGPWAAGVLNSGGTLIIKGGTFSNDNFGDNSLATAARGLLLADTGANIQVEGGEFNAVKGIIDIQNNLGDASKNPVVTISGGSFSSDPLTYNGLINLAEGLAVYEDGSRWKVFNPVTDGISNASQMFAFAKMVNEGVDSFSNKTVTLKSDIDLVNKDWEPIGQTGKTTFNGVFDGNNKTITNLKIDSTKESDEGHYASGLFGWTENGTIKNLNVNTAMVEGGHLCAAIVGYISGTASVSECIVTHAQIICKDLDENDTDPEGDKAACIVGQVGGSGAKVYKCSASDSTVSAGRDGGQIVGAALGDIANSVTECTVSNVIVTANGTSTGENVNNEIIGRTN